MYETPVGLIESEEGLDIVLPCGTSAGLGQRLAGVGLVLRLKITQG